MNKNECNDAIVQETRRRYADILDLPHHDPVAHQRMPMHARAAQFAPFAALVGHSDTIDETARLTDEKIELAEDNRVELDRILNRLRSMMRLRPIVCITCFVADSRKHGGEYRCYRCRVDGIDEQERMLLLDNGQVVSMDMITEINIEE